MLLSKCVYYVAVTFKMTECIEKQILIQFCNKLEHSSAETIWMFEKATAWVIGAWQLHHNVPTHTSHLSQSFFEKHQIMQVIHTPYISDFTPWDLWLFPKLKLSSKGKRVQIVDEIEENMMGLLMVIGRTV